MLKAIQNRRSIREYSEKKISEKDLNTIIDAGLTTPTSMNMKQYKIIVVKKGEINPEELSKLTFGQPHIQNAQFLTFVFTLRKNAVVASDIEEALSHVPAEKRSAMAEQYLPNYQTHNDDLTGAAHAITMNLVTQASSMGIGSTIFTGFARNEINEFFAKTIKDDRYSIVVGVSFGYPKDGYVPFDKQIDKTKVIHYKK